jgi:hypothetical protein
MTPEEKAILTEILPLIDEIRDRDDLDLLRDLLDFVAREMIVRKMGTPESLAEEVFHCALAQQEYDSTKQ